MVRGAKPPGHLESLFGEERRKRHEVENRRRGDPGGRPGPLGGRLRLGQHGRHLGPRGGHPGQPHPRGIGGGHLHVPAGPARDGHQHPGRVPHPVPSPGVGLEADRGGGGLQQDHPVQRHRQPGQHHDAGSDPHERGGGGDRHRPAAGRHAETGAPFCAVFSQVCPKGHRGLTRPFSFVTFGPLGRKEVMRRRVSP